MALQEHLGREITHTMPIEAGGLNSTMPFTVAARLGLPVVDADGMGRAFPEVQMVTATIYGIAGDADGARRREGQPASCSTAPSTTAGPSGSRARSPSTWARPRWSRSTRSPAASSRRRWCRARCGLATELGALVREARARHDDPVAAIVERLRGRRLFAGKIIDVERRTVAGFTRGEARARGARRRRRRRARARVPERVPGRPARRGRAGLGAGPDHGRRLRHGRADDDRGAALRLPRRGARRALRPALAHGRPGSRSSGRAASATTSTSCALEERAA